MFVNNAFIYFSGPRPVYCVAFLREKLLCRRLQGPRDEFGEGGKGSG